MTYRFQTECASTGAQFTSGGGMAFDTLEAARKAATEFCAEGMSVKHIIHVSESGILTDIPVEIGHNERRDEPPR